MAAVEPPKHVWRLGERLDRDDVEQGGYDSYHSGPVCILCGDAFCTGCDAKGMEGECVSDPEEHERLPEQLRRYAELTGKLSGQLNDAQARLREAAKTLEMRDRQIASADYAVAQAETRKRGAEYEVSVLKEEIARLNMVAAGRIEVPE